jgi:cell volume regulation protein A
MAHADHAFFDPGVAGISQPHRTGDRLGLLISLFLILVARPLGVFISLAFFSTNFRSKVFLSWVGLRGGVPIVFATYPLIAGIEKADTIFNLVFFISVSSVLLQGTTLGFVAKLLHLDVPSKTRRRTTWKEPRILKRKVAGGDHR